MGASPLRSALLSYPVDPLLPELAAVLGRSACALLVAEPGAGKSTRVPPHLLQQEWCEGRILLLEPRRLAARATAHFMAANLGQSLGETVGLRTRVETRISAQTRIEVVTEGVLTRMLVADPSLEGVGLVIFDEFHERSLDADTGLALVRQCQQLFRPDLRLLVMSATLDVVPLAALLGDAPVLEAGGRRYPVTIEHAAPGRRDQWEPHLHSVVADWARRRPGTTLVFLPGRAEIERARAALSSLQDSGITVQALHGDMAPGEQNDVLQTPAGRHRVVLATAIAQTSVTLADVHTVIDAGLERRPVFDARRGITRLQTVRLAQHTAAQRAGRAGRTGPGHCLRLWPESEPLELAAPAEVTQADLAGLVLTLAAWGCHDPAELDWLDPPPPANWRAACDLLAMLGALEPDGRLTETGRLMMELPLSPRLARLRLAADALGQGTLGARLAALMSDRDPLPGRGADLEARLVWLSEGPGSRQPYWRRLVSRLSRGALDSPDAEPVSPGDLLAVAWPDRVARRRGQDGRYLMANGQGARLDPDDPMVRCDTLVMVDIQGGERSADAFCRMAAALDMGRLASLWPDQLTQRERVFWDPDLERVRAVSERCFGALVLASQPLARPSPEQSAAVILEEVRRHGLDWLGWDEDDRQWLARVAWARKVIGDDWPDLSEAVLLADLDSWLGPWLAGVSTRADIAALSARRVLAQRCPAGAAGLEALIPAQWTGPDGRRWRVDWLSGQGPQLALPLQAVLGERASPSVADGRLTLSLVLLSPAGRPLAITRDLASFWQDGYRDVRREMRGRYPKHYWPEDPLQAKPARPGRKPE